MHVLIFGIIALILNIIWEFSHHFLYIDLSGIPKYPHLWLASFADTLIILIIFAIISLRRKNFNWIKSASLFLIKLILNICPLNRIHKQ